MSRKMQAVPGSSLAREELSVADLKPYLKLRLGGSRSSAVLSKFLRDAVYNPPTRFDSSKSSREHVRSLDSQSVSSRSSDSSANTKKVRIVGRGGAGARLRDYSKGHNNGPAPAPIVEMAPHDVPVLRTVGRGGLGSRPKAVLGTSKAEPRGREPSFELRDMRKVSKQVKRSLSFDPDPEVRPESSRRSTVSSISTIHFAGETGLPSPDFFKVTKRFQKRPLLETPDSIHEAFDLERTLSLESSCSTSATPWDNTPTESRSSLDLSRKEKRRERPFSQLFSMFQNDVRRKYNSTSSPSMSTLPSQITLTSIDTDPSYFFHGPGSPPSGGRETDSTTGSSSSARVGSSVSSFQREFSPGSSMPSSKQEEIGDCHEIDGFHDECHDEEIDEGQDQEIDECHDEEIDGRHDEEIDERDDEEIDERHDEEIDERDDEEIDESNDEEIHEPSAQPDQRKHSPTTPRNGISLISHTLTLHLSPSEATALGHYPPLHGPDIHIPANENVPFVTPTMPKTEGSMIRSVKSESWTGEWNAAMVDVMKALRELR